MAWMPAPMLPMIDLERTIMPRTTPRFLVILQPSSSKDVVVMLWFITAPLLNLDDLILPVQVIPQNILGQLVGGGINQSPLVDLMHLLQKLALTKITRVVLVAHHKSINGDVLVSHHFHFPQGALVSAFIGWIS